jgi:hypothetical protein
VAPFLLGWHRQPEPASAPPHPSLASPHLSRSHPASRPIAKVLTRSTMGRLSRRLIGMGCHGARSTCSATSPELDTFSRWTLLRGQLLT